MPILKILTFVFLIPGIFTIFSARWMVKKFSLDENIKCEYEDSMSENEVMLYKNNKAVINVKMLGMLIALPGFIMAVIAFK
ncbi:MAG: hypothetical protein ACOX7R_02500 [Acetivibrionales bacterium]